MTTPVVPQLLLTMSGVAVVMSLQSLDDQCAVQHSLTREGQRTETEPTVPNRPDDAVMGRGDVGASPPPALGEHPCRGAVDEPGAWDGYAAQAVRAAGVQALRTG